jgi:LacI family transcriptional regulator
MTIKEIAKLANVSPGTVDRVIHNRGGVSKATEDKIQTILKEHNFEKNLLASTLAMKKKFVIAVLVPSANGERDFWFKPQKGIHDAWKEIKDYGFKVESYYFDQFELKTFATAFDQIKGLNPDAVVIAPVFQEMSKKFCLELDDLNIPYLFINIDIEGMQNLTYIGQDSAKAGELAGKLMHLLIHEQKELLIVRKKRKFSMHHSIDDRINGFRNYFTTKNLKVTISELELENNRKEEMDHLTRFLLKNPDIGGIFVPSSFVNAIAKFLFEFELSKIKLIGFDIYKESEEYLKTEVIDFLITQKPYDQGYLSVKSIADYLLFGKDHLKKRFAPIKIITKENVDFHQWVE